MPMHIIFLVNTHLSLKSSSNNVKPHTYFGNVTGFVMWHYHGRDEQQEKQ